MTDSAPAPLSRERHLHWGAQDLWARLEPLLPGLSVEVLARSASTNTELLERARITPRTRPSGYGDLPDYSERIGRRQADTQPCLLVAEHQTAGRGRLGRGWRSARGASLTFSLALPLAPLDWSGLSLAVGVALAEALQSAPTTSRLRLGLKWPNDLWLLDSAAPSPEAAVQDGRKLGGVLIETLVAGSQRLAVIGVGLNITPLPDPLPLQASPRPACLREIDPDATAPLTLAHVARPLVEALRLFERDGFAAFAERFAARDVLRGHKIDTTHGSAVHGVARGVDDRGALQVQTSGGLQRLSSGEVSVRPSRAVPLT